MSFMTSTLNRMNEETVGEHLKNAEALFEKFDLKD
jgi:hypothetical protein